MLGTGTGMNQPDPALWGQSITAGERGPHCPQGAVPGAGHKTLCLRPSAGLWVKHSFVSIIT